MASKDEKEEIYSKKVFTLGPQVGPIIPFNMEEFYSANETKRALYRTRFTNIL